VKDSYWKYLWRNSWLFFAWLGIVGFFIWYWVTFQDNFQADVRNTLLGCAAFLAAIMIALYFKWRKL